MVNRAARVPTPTSDRGTCNHEPDAALAPLRRLHTRRNPRRHRHSGHRRWRGDRQHRAGRARSVGALEYAAQRAQFRNELLGVSAVRHAIRYWRRDIANDRWQPVDDDDLLRARALPEPVDAMAIAYAGRAPASDAVIPLRASGRNEPFAFALTTPAWRTLIAVDPLNRVSIAGPSALPP